MKHTPSKTQLSAAALSAMFLLTTPNEIHAANDPVITFTFPDHIKLSGGQRQKTVSGSLLKKQFDENGKIKKLKITCEFAQALDPNNQDLKCGQGKLPGVYKAMRHFASRAHKTCRKQFGQLETRIRELAGDTDIKRDVDRMVGRNWENDDYCPLIDARDQIMQEYKRLGLTAF